MLQDISGGSIGHEISSIVDKITNILKKHSVAADQIDEAFSFQLIEYSPAPEAVFRTVLEGCLKRKRLNFKYHSPASEEKSSRTVEPYHLFNYMGTWHLLGYCHMRNEIRDFVLGRITDVRMLNETFKIPSDFNMKDYFRSSFGIYKGKSIQEVTLRFTPEKAKWIKDQVWHKEQKVKLLKDGSLEIRFPVSDFSEIKREILRHGSDIEVIKPKSLRELIKSEAINIAKIY